MTTQKVAIQQLKRLGGLAFRPDTDEAWAELRHTLAQVARGEGEAEKIVSAWLTNTDPDEKGQPLGRRFPAPAELILMAQRVREQAKEQAGPEGCKECSGLGLKLVTSTIVRCHECGRNQAMPRDPFCKFCDTDLRPFLIEQSDTMDYCDCPKGIWRRDHDRERKAGAA